MVELVMTNELACLMLNARVDDSASLKADPKGYIFSRFNCELGDDISCSVAENDSKNVHVALPYYSGIDNGTAFNIADGEMGNASGGEVIISLACILEDQRNNPHLWTDAPFGSKTLRK